MMNKDKDFYTMKDFENQIQKKYPKKYLEYQVLKKWEEIIGSQIAKNSHVEKYEKSILYITSHDSMWLNAIFLAKNEILEKYKKAFPKLYFNDLKVVFSKNSHLDRESKKLKSLFEEKRKEKVKSMMDDYYPMDNIQSEFLRLKG